MDKKKLFKSEEQKKSELLFITVSILFGLCFFFFRIGNDDLTRRVYYEDSLMDGWNWVWGMVSDWSSRLIINFIWMVVGRYNKPSLMLYSAVSMYAYLKALYLLSGKKDDFKLSLFITGVAMSFPFAILSTSGWATATTSYFGPTACMLLALVPLRKFYDGEKIPLWADIIYILSMIYSANAEQNVIVLIAVYAVGIVYFLVKRKKCSFRLILHLLLAIAGLTFTLTCRGNWIRKTQEVKDWFPTYNMLDTVDKIELGLSTTLHWMFCDGQILMILLCAVMMALVWKKYQDLLYRILSAVPVLAVLLLGPLRPILLAISPITSTLVSEINSNGAFNVAQQGRGAGPLQVGVYLCLIVCLGIEIFLINDTPEGCIWDFLMAVLGVGTRVMMGLSPTIHASSTRTYTAFLFCISALVVHDYSIFLKEFGKTSKKQVMPYLSVGLIVLGFISLLSALLTMFY
ncbi:MAG: hypothetical protein J6Y08_04155 [Clostridiales bacterium]|nr:hypothetical protein [Clostridiales bacterium]